jgi:hypothetical protein
LGWESEEERERIARDIKCSLFSGNLTNEGGNDYLVRGNTEGGEGKNCSSQESNGGRWLKTTGNQIEERKHKDGGDLNRTKNRGDEPRSIEFGGEKQDSRQINENNIGEKIAQIDEKAGTSRFGHSNDELFNHSWRPEPAER